MGYVIIDHSASLPSVQRQYGKIVEYDTVQCKHCTGVIKVIHRQQTGLWCRTCGGPVHDNKACGARCEPFFRKIEQQLRREKLLIALGVEK